MSMFRRRQAPAHDEMTAIRQFWAWWPTARPRIESAISTGDYGRLHEEIAEKVMAIDPSLQWELSAGTTSQHAFVLSTGGNVAKRATTELWLRQAPLPDDVWEFQPARVASPSALDARLQTEAFDIDLALTTAAFTLDESRQVYDVAVFHPEFGGLPEQDRGQITFLVLDWLLGEDGVERWVGNVEFPTEPPAGAAPAAELRDAVAALAAAPVDEDSWVILSSTGRPPLMATVRRPLKRIDHLFLDHHAAVSVRYTSANDGGLPVDPSLSKLHAFDDFLSAAASSALFIGTESSAGTRVFHFYAADGADLRAALEPVVKQWSEGPARIDVTADPGWEHIAHLR